MIDLHHHLLFGVDDGSPDLETSVRMVEMAAEDGITHVVATPHANSQFSYDRAAHMARLQQIRDALPAGVASRMTLGLGCDFHVDFENLERIRTAPRTFTINETEYLLIELPDNGIPARLDEILYDLRVQGLTPILTHPERNATLQRSLAPLRQWLRGDLLVQVTAGSLSGIFGKKAEQIGWKLVEDGWAHFVSTDAHNLTRRPPNLSAAYALVERHCGMETARRLFVSNPLAVFQGKPLPPQPAPKGVHELPQVAVPWWKRILNR